MTRARHRDPLVGATLLVIDGSNQRARTAASQPPEEAALVAGLRVIVPPPTRIVVVLDTDAPSGSSTVRTVGGVTIRHARAGGGDDLIVSLTETEPMRTLVVTDDRQLRGRVVELGARTEGNAWLRRLRERGRAAAPSVGGRRPPAPARADPPDDAGTEAEDVRRWRPGRGATVKHGNPKRRPRRGSL